MFLALFFEDEKHCERYIRGFFRECILKFGNIKLQMPVSYPSKDDE